MSYSAARLGINDLIRIAPGGSREKGPGVLAVSDDCVGLSHQLSLQFLPTLMPVRKGRLELNDQIVSGCLNLSQVPGEARAQSRPLIALSQDNAPL